MKSAVFMSIKFEISASIKQQLSYQIGFAALKPEQPTLVIDRQPAGPDNTLRDQ